MSTIATGSIPSGPNRIHFLIGLVMLITAALSIVMIPKYKIKDGKTPINLETMIPKHFNNWKIDDSIAPLIPDLTQTKIIRDIYDQTLSRTYVNDQGEQVMLSLAYGGNQRDSLRLHNPEVCYSSQGFQVTKPIEGYVHTNITDIPVKRLVAVKDARHEPITYWIVMGDKAVANNWYEKLEKITLGLKGVIPDGLLFRVSMISDNENSSYQIQNKFINELLSSVNSDSLKILVGNVTQ